MGENNVAGRLSHREREVLSLIADGRTNAEIANRLGVGFDTVRTYIKRLNAKLGIEGTKPGARRRVEYGEWAVRLGLSGGSHVDRVEGPA